VLREIPIHRDGGSPEGRGAAWTEPVVEAGKWDGAWAEDPAEEEENGDNRWQCRFWGTGLSFGQRTNKTKMLTSRVAIVQSTMQGITSGQGGGQN
jgi:hypothetical protein